MVPAELNFGRSRLGSSESPRIAVDGNNIREIALDDTNKRNMDNGSDVNLKLRGLLSFSFDENSGLGLTTVGQDNEDIEKFLGYNKSNHYTSHLQIREEVDRFDFDTGIDVEFANRQRSERIYSEIEKTEGDEEDILQHALTSIKKMSKEMISMIDKIDDSLLYPIALTYPPETITEPIIYKLIETLNRISYIKEDNDEKYNDELINHHPPSLEDLYFNEPCYKLENFGVILVKWPESIRQLWEEYAKIPRDWSHDYTVSFSMNIKRLCKISNLKISKELIMKRNMSIRDLENKFGSSWRNQDKNFSRQINRRKKIWNSIEDGLRDGLTLEECVETLEQFARVTNRSLSSYYRGVPFKLTELKRRLNNKQL